MEHEFECKDRFDLEMEISALTNYVDQIKMVSRVLVEDEFDVDKELAANALNGIAVLLDMHQNKLMDTMCQVLNLSE